MPFLSSRAKYVLVGAGIGAGVVLLTPIVIPVVVAVARPLTKAVLKQTLLVYERSREGAARFWEGLEDLVAEVRDEIDDELRAEGATDHEKDEKAGEARHANGHSDAPLRGV